MSVEKSNDLVGIEPHGVSTSYAFHRINNNIVACRAVTRKRHRDKQIYQSRYWVTRFANKTHSHGNDLNNVSAATNQHTAMEELLETVFSTVVSAEETQSLQLMLVQKI
jgi:hypothetical protein